MLINSWSTFWTLVFNILTNRAEEGSGGGVRGQGSGAGRSGGRGVGAQVAWNLFMPKVEQLLVNKLIAKSTC